MAKEADNNAATGSRLSAGAVIFSRLRALGVDYVFANSGTDFPPIIEGLAQAAAAGEKLPEAVVVPHEHAAMGMAHGHYLISGRAQAVMLHTNVGLANGAIGAINAACENVPVLLMSGRTPTTESARFGSRTVPIGWGQEMRDQAALVRESCKWDCELRVPEHAGELLDRGHAIAGSTPRGPVYISLPREVLCEPSGMDGAGDPPKFRPMAAAPDPGGVAEAAEWLAGAERPLVIAQRGAGDRRSFEAFSEMATEWGLPVCSWWATALAISTEHACHVGPDPGPWLERADVVLVLNSLAPWWPDRHRINPSARVINMGPDPIFSRFPVRNFRSDLSIGGELSISVPMLAAELSKHRSDAPFIRNRLKRVKERSAKIRKGIQDSARSTAGGVTKALASAILSDALEGIDSTVFSELGAVLGPLKRTDHNSWFQEPHSGGLGWSFPAAIGARLADPGRACVATMGDGSYIFSNPVACHHVADSLGAPVLAVVLNNGEWGAVRRSVADLYPDGHAVKANEMPLTSLSPSPDFPAIAKAGRAWTRSVDRAEELLPAFSAALSAVMKEKRQAFVEVKLAPS